MRSAVVADQARESLQGAGGPGGYSEPVWIAHLLTVELCLLDTGGKVFEDICLLERDMQGDAAPFTVGRAAVDLREVGHLLRNRDASLELHCKRIVAGHVDEYRTEFVDAVAVVLVIDLDWYVGRPGPAGTAPMGLVDIEQVLTQR